jgi:hypothetical protein
MSSAFKVLASRDTISSRMSNSSSAQQIGPDEMIDTDCTARDAVAEAGAADRGIARQRLTGAEA